MRALPKSFQPILANAGYSLSEILAEMTNGGCGFDVETG
jgi:hypothetical protein